MCHYFGAFPKNFKSQSPQVSCLTKIVPSQGKIEINNIGGIVANNNVIPITRATCTFPNGLWNRPHRVFKSPVVDGTILPKRPIDAVRDGDAKDKALMVGFNSDEWNLFLQTPLFGNLGDSASKKALDDAGLLAMFKKSLPNQAENAVQLYYQGKEDSETARLQAYSEMETDRMFRLPTYQLLEAQRQHQANTYGYQVTWQAPGLGGKLGACHAVEVPFVFGLLGGMIGQLFVGDEEKAKPLSDKIISAWSGFAKNSTPQSAFADWPVFEEKHGALMALGEKCGPISALDENTKKFWYPLMY